MSYTGLYDPVYDTQFVIHGLSWYIFIYIYTLIYPVCIHGFGIYSYTGLVYIHIWVWLIKYGRALRGLESAFLPVIAYITRSARHLTKHAAELLPRSKVFGIMGGQERAP